MRNISERPESVGTRRYKGHWEIDTVHGRGSRHSIVIPLERQTGYVMTGKRPNSNAVVLQTKLIVGQESEPALIRQRGCTMENEHYCHGWALILGPTEFAA